MADKRWKAVERNVASALTEKLSDIGMVFERIPLLGRDGPDLTVNRSGLVINVKSRACTPVRLLPGSRGLTQIGGLVCFRLEDIRSAHTFTITQIEKPWKQLQDWYDWMDAWTQQQPNGAKLSSCILLHRPRLPIGKCGLVIHNTHMRRLRWKIRSS